ncbi:MAG: hypothetical protein JSW10_08210 [Pseudomonadota bacterium]|nr:MAG: hypothetical protein JSW10_08210 [Pseudomonadota bacterium]
MTTIGLAGPSLPGPDPHCYAAGAHFLELLTFLGCSPAVTLEPSADAPSDQAFCYLRIKWGEHGMEFLKLRDDPMARCPACRKTPANWQASALGTDSLTRAVTLSCPHCAAQIAPLDLDWRREAGLCSLRVEVVNIHPHEAVPVERLLARLAEVTGSAWDYFYCRTND